MSKKKAKSFKDVFFKTLSLILGLALLLSPILYDYHKSIDKNKQLAAFEENINNNLNVEDDSKDSSVIDVSSAGLKMIGVLYVPSINLTIPIYDGESEQALNKGAGLLYGTGPLQGGENYRPTVSSHSGLSIGELFTKLPQVKIGDKFYTKDKFGEIRAYEVVMTEVVEPTSRDALKPVLGKDYFTLLTCVPIFINTERLLVTGERIPYEGDMLVNTNFFETYKTYLLFVLLFLIFLWIIKKIKEQKRKKNQKKVEVDHEQ